MITTRTPRVRRASFVVVDPRDKMTEEDGDLNDCFEGKKEEE